MNEEWRRWRDSNYEVSDTGRVRRALDGRRTLTGRILTPTLLKVGYFKVSPVIAGKNVFTYVHAIVAEAFIGERAVGYEVNHIDGNKQNNTTSNLEYVTHAGNMRHARATGLSPVGERCNKGKLTTESVLAMRLARHAGDGLAAIAARFGVAKSTASQAINAKRWGHVS